MISNAVIKKYGLDSKSLEKLFTAEVPEANIARLTQLIADRIKDGKLRNLADYKTWAAVDSAYDTPFAQTTPTLIRGIMDSCGSTKDVLEALRGWGISEEKLFTKTSVEGKDRYELNEPLFNDVFVPLVRAYLTVRLSKIFNDRNLTPLFEYPPREFTSQNRITCRVITEIVESVATDFGYGATLRDWIFNALMYSVAIKFPVEAWKQYLQEDSDGNEIIEKEGVRYVVPHITRMYYDLTYPLHTLNTGTGCSYCGYWTILKWGDVAMDEKYWNRAQVPHGTNWLDPSTAWYNYFKEVYPCSMSFPAPRQSRSSDREHMASRYNRTDFDSAFFLTYHFMELTPKDWGIGDYPNKVWMRFTVGGDDTVMYAETFNYNPCQQIGYDADSGRGRNASLALEIIPFQDITGNVLSQFLLTIKRNLANIVFYDTDAVDPDQLNTLKRRSNDQYKGINFVGFSGLAMDREGAAIDGAFKEVKFQFVDTNQILSGLNTTIAMLERLLVVSSQEIGASASHQQSKKEVELTNANTSNRVAYTASFVDDGIEAWKRSLAEAVITNMDGREVMATIPTDIPNLEQHLQELGFEFAEHSPTPGQTHTVVKGKLDKIRLSQVVARRSDASRENDTVAATMMMQTLQTVANSQLLSQYVDPSSIVEMMEYVARLGGADDDFKIRLNQNAMMADKLQQTIQNIQQQLMASVEKEVVQPTAQAIASIQKEIQTNSQQIAQEVAKLQQQLSAIEQFITQSRGMPSPQQSTVPPPMPPSPPPSPMPAPSTMAQPVAQPVPA